MRETREQAARRIIDDLRYAHGGRIRHHVALNSRDTPRYIIIDVEQNRRDVRK